MTVAVAQCLRDVDMLRIVYRSVGTYVARSVPVSMDVGLASEYNRTKAMVFNLGLHLPPGVREDLLGVRKIKKNKYKRSSIISLTSQNHIN